jgi:hypothetical protein
MELNEDLSNKLFIHPPQDPCTFNILPMNKIITSQNHDIIMFPILMNIMIKGANILFGESIMPHNMNENQFNILKKYMASIGYFVRSSYTNNENDIPVINIWFQRIKILTDCHGIKKIM